MRTFTSYSEVLSCLGQEVAVTDWITVTQQQIQQFADATGDQQWIHVDPERAAAGPFGTPIAHGFLTLSLLPITSYELLADLKPTKSVNYGMDKLRFMSPVKAGARVRNHIKLLAVEPRDDGWVLLRSENTVEIEGQDKPALVAVTLGLMSWD